MRSYRFRLYPSKKQEKEMRQHIWLSKNLWNDILAHCQKTYSDFGMFPTKGTIAILTKNSGLYSQVAQEVGSRVVEAVWRYIKLKKARKKAGFPRFKSLDRLKSLKYPQSGFSLTENKKLKITPFGEISIVKHREVKGKIKTLTLKRESSGKWYACFSVEEDSVPIPSNNKPKVGIDLGLKTLATLSDGTTIKNPRHLRKAQDKLAQLQRKLSKKKRGSRNRLKTKYKLALAFERLTDTRRDFLHKVTTKLVNSYSLISLEKLNSQDMAEERYGKSINDASWGSFANMISYKAASAGCQVVFVNPKNTTQECSQCHEIVKKDLSQRIHSCPTCNLVLDRDLNAARNILIRATEGHSGSNASGVQPIGWSVKEEAHPL